MSEVTLSEVTLSEVTPRLVPLVFMCGMREWYELFNARRCGPIVVRVVGIVYVNMCSHTRCAQPCALRATRCAHVSMPATAKQTKRTQPTATSCTCCTPADELLARLTSDPEEAKWLQFVEAAQKLEGFHQARFVQVRDIVLGGHGIVACILCLAICAVLS